MPILQKPRSIVSICLSVLALGLVLIGGDSRAQPGLPADAPPAFLEAPKWEVGQTWVVETVTEKLQGREETASREPARIRWQFKVAAIEKLGDRECYRIDVTCEARGRIRPSTTIWCDKNTLFLRQIRTQLPVTGRYREVVESYEVASDGPAPVISPITALPIALPVFLPKGAKSDGEFIHTSKPVPAGVEPKSLGILAFAHSVKQQVVQPDAAAMKLLPDSYSKDLGIQPVVKVELGQAKSTVVQMWKKGAPWPVYVDNGNTKAYLVPGN